ncbi:hypothetical protein [Sinorhizobium psoraleae]|uniref:hypothetical protein n=1 Tax=Sinorhizobium psoraleae TaxID=520838 RepID=UPI0015682CBC|nr:hypothetical protein [Sinorhizobium psoraleae]
MRVSMKTSFAAIVLSSALAGVSGSAFADSYYQGIDPHNPPGTQNRGTMLVPTQRAPYYVDEMPTGSIYVDPMSTGSIYVDPMSTGSIYVDPRSTGSVSGAPGEVRERYRNEYHGPGEGDYYQGIMPPAPVP